MNGRVAKELRREENRIAHQTMGMVSEPLTALINNEAINRKRLDVLEVRADRLEIWRRAFLDMGAKERLLWLFLGR